MEKQPMLKDSNYQGYGNQPGGYPPPQSAQPTAPYPQPATQGYPPSGAPGYQQPAGPGYPPANVANESYQTNMQGYPPAKQPAGYTQPPQPAGKYATGPDTGSDQNSLPSAPPLDNMDQIDGYGGNNFDNDAFAAPPSYEEATRPPPERSNNQQFRGENEENTSEEDNSRVPVINEDTARNALMDEVSEHCCWGSGPAKNLKFLDLQSSSAIHYTLESFTEGRATKWAYEPYMGQPIDSPAYGPAPMPWAVQLPQTTMFVNNVVKTEVPHTASIKPCHTCMGMGRTRCHSCHAKGWSQCHSCHGSGRTRQFDEDRDCTFCHGRGRKDCVHCHGNGTKECHTCRGRAQLKCYIKLTVTYTNRYEDFVGDQTKLPLEMLRKVNGEVAFQEEYPRVFPLNTYPDPKINRASQQLVNKHSTAFPTERILMQRQKVRIIPITDVIYKYNDKQGNYLVYGHENKVLITDYPSTVCGCCVLL